MPLWNNTDFTETLQLGVPIEVMTATVMTDGQKTQAVAIPPNTIRQGISLAFFAKFASNPGGTVDYQLQIAFNNVDAEFFVIGSTMTNSETVGGMVITSDLVARFARVIANDADTVAVTIQILMM